MEKYFAEGNFVAMVDESARKNERNLLISFLHSSKIFNQMVLLSLIDIAENDLLVRVLVFEPAKLLEDLFLGIDEIDLPLTILIAIIYQVIYHPIDGDHLHSKLLPVQLHIFHLKPFLKIDIDVTHIAVLKNITFHLFQFWLDIFLHFKAEFFGRCLKFFGRCLNIL